MRRIFFSIFLAMLIIPTFRSLVACTSYSNQIYDFESNGARGTLKKSQTCSDGRYTINSTINVSKGWFSKTIIQQASGRYADKNRIFPENYTIFNKSVPLKSKQMDQLSLALYLSDSLNAGISKFPLIKLLYNGNSMLAQCVITDRIMTIQTGSGKNVSATRVLCSKEDNSMILNYTFSKDSAATMLSLSTEENGKQVLSALIKNYEN